MLEHFLALVLVDLLNDLGKVRYPVDLKAHLHPSNLFYVSSPLFFGQDTGDFLQNFETPLASSPTVEVHVPKKSILLEFVEILLGVGLFP